MEVTEGNKPLRIRRYTKERLELEGGHSAFYYFARASDPEGFMITTAISKGKIAGGSFLLEWRTADEVFTPEDFSEQHRLIGQTAEQFAQNEIVPNIEKMEHKDFSVTRELLKKAGELGLSGVEIPEAYGGLEMDKVTAAVIADHMAKYAGFATTWGGHSGIGTLPIVYFGTEEQKK